MCLGGGGNQSKSPEKNRRGGAVPMIRQNGDKRKAEIREEDFYDTSRGSALLFEARRVA